MPPPLKHPNEMTAAELLRRFVEKATYEIVIGNKLFECCLGCDQWRDSKARYIRHDDDCLIIAAAKVTGKRSKQDASVNHWG